MVAMQTTRFPVAAAAFGCHTTSCGSGFYPRKEHRVIPGTPWRPFWRVEPAPTMSAAPTPDRAGADLGRDADNAVPCSGRLRLPHHFLWERVLPAKRTPRNTWHPVATFFAGRTRSHNVCGSYPGPRRSRPWPRLQTTRNQRAKKRRTHRVRLFLHQVDASCQSSPTRRCGQPCATSSSRCTTAAAPAKSARRCNTASITTRLASWWNCHTP